MYKLTFLSAESSRIVIDYETETFQRIYIEVSQDFNQFLRAIYVSLGE